MSVGSCKVLSNDLRLLVMDYCKVLSNYKVLSNDLPLLVMNYCKVLANDLRLQSKDHCKVLSNDLLPSNDLRLEVMDICKVLSNDLLHSSSAHMLTIFQPHQFSPSESSRMILHIPSLCNKKGEPTTKKKANEPMKHFFKQGVNNMAPKTETWPTCDLNCARSSSYICCDGLRIGHDSNI